MSINGNDYDWESMEIRLPDGVAIDIEDINYGDEAPVEEHYGKGITPFSYGRKNYKAEGDMTLGLFEAERLRKKLGGSFYKGGLFNIVVGYANDNQSTVTDTLPDVKIIKNKTGGKQGDDKVGVRKLEFKILSPIKWNGTEAIQTQNTGRE